MKKLLLAFLFLLTVNSGFSQWTSNPNVNTPVATQEAFSENYSASISDGAGGVIIVYTTNVWDYMTSESSTMVHAQRLSAAGVAQWGVNGIVVAVDAEYPILSTDGNGGAVILWAKETTYPNNDTKLYGQRLDQNGNKLWATNGVEITATSSEYYLSSVMHDTNGFVLIYNEDKTGGYDMYVQKLDMNGALQWGANGLKVNDSSGDFSGVVYKDGSNYLVVFGEEYEIGLDDEGMRVYWQKLNANGTKNGTNIEIEDLFPAGGLDFYVENLAYDGNGGIYYTTTGDNDNEAKLYLQHIAANGTKSFNATTWGIEVDASIGKPTGFGYVDYGVSMESDGEGGVIVGWTDVRNGNYGIYAQRFNISGTKLWSGTDVTVIPTSVSNRFYDGHIKRDIDGNFVFLAPKDIGGNNNHLYVQKISPSGSTLYPAEGIFAAGKNTSKYAEMVVSGDKVVIVWEEFGGDDYDIYAQSVFSNGVLPVSLISFHATSKTIGASLTWSTASELNNKHFVLEKSADGVSFTPIATLAGQGTSSIKSNYQYIDKDFNGSAYYRLTQVDLNGEQVVYTDLVKYLKFTGLAVVAYPNPTTGQLFVNTDGIKINSEVRLTDIKGKVVEAKAAIHSPLIFEVSHLPAGLYFIEYNDGLKTQIKKVIKQ